MTTAVGASLHFTMQILQMWSANMPLCCFLAWADGLKSYEIMLFQQMPQIECSNTLAGRIGLRDCRANLERRWLTDAVTVRPTAVLCHRKLYVVGHIERHDSRSRTYSPTRLCAPIACRSRLPSRRSGTVLVLKGDSVEWVANARKRLFPASYASG
jgi:hypothetical protein